MSARKPWKVHTQQWISGKWGFWILAPNNATVAKSCLLYAWRSNGIEVVDR